MSAMMPISHRLFAAALLDNADDRKPEPVSGFEFQVPGWRAVRPEKPVVIEVPAWIAASQISVRAAKAHTWSARVGA